MTREECEQAIAKQVKIIWDIYKEYVPKGTYLTLTVSNGKFMFWDNPSDKNIDSYGTI